MPQKLITNSWYTACEKYANSVIYGTKSIDTR